MRRFFVSLVLLTSFANFASGQECDKAKLRECIELPRGRLDILREWEDSDETTDLATQIAIETKRLTGRVEDAEIYFKISECYDQLKDKKNGDANHQKALDLVKPHLDTTDPKKVPLLVLYCQNAPFAEWEKCAPTLVRLAPDHAGAWATLGMIHMSKCAHIVLGIKNPDMEHNWDTGRMAQALLEGDVFGPALDEAEKNWNEARRCFERMRALAPNLVWHGVPICGYGLDMNLLTAFAKARGKAPPSPEAMLADLLTTARRAAELSPDNASIQSFAMLWELTHVAQKSVAVGRKPDLWKFAASPEDKNRLYRYLKRFERIADKAGESKRSVSNQIVLLGMSTMMGEPSDTERFARRILQADPKNDEAALGLWLALCETKRFNEADDVARNQWARHPTAQSAFMQARNLSGNRQDQQAEKLLRLAVKQWPEDIYCVLGLCAIVMKTNEKTDVLAEAGTWLQQAESLIAVASNPAIRQTQLDNCEYLSTIHAALSGDTVLARLKLQRLQGENPGDERFAKALSAFKR